MMDVYRDRYRRTDAAVETMDVVRNGHRRNSQKPPAPKHSVRRQPRRGISSLTVPKPIGAKPCCGAGCDAAGAPKAGAGLPKAGWEGVDAPNPKDALDLEGIGGNQGQSIA